MINLGKKWIHLGVLVSALLLSGCSSCRQSSTAPPAGQARRQGAKAGPVASPTRAVAKLPTARTLPTFGEPHPAAQAEAPATREAGEEIEEEPEEADCIVLADAEPDFGPPPLQVKFEADYECYEDTTVKVTWNFGDGSTSNEVNPAHTYNEAGEYLATVTLTTPDGATTDDEIDISVEEEDYE